MFLLFLCILKFNNFHLCGWILLILVSFFCITLAFDIIIFLVSISYPDHLMQVVQKLTAEDHTARISFAEFILQKMAVDPNFLRKIIFSDEALFHLEGGINKYNSTHCSISNRKFGSTAIFWRMNSAKEILAVWSSVVSFRTICGIIWIPKIWLYQMLR